MDVAGAHSPLQEGSVDASTLCFFGGRSFTLRLNIILVGGGYRNEAAVQKTDYFLIGERTRPQGKCPASTAPGFDSAIVGEEEYRPVQITAQPLGFEYPTGPADLVNCSLCPARLQPTDPFFYPFGQILVVGHRGRK